MLGNHKVKQNPQTTLIELQNQRIYNKYSDFDKADIHTIFFEYFENKDVLRLIIALNKHKKTGKSIILSTKGLVLIDENKIYYKTENSIQVDYECSGCKSLGSKSFYYGDIDIVDNLKAQYDIFGDFDSFLSLIYSILNDLGIYQSDTISKFYESNILDCFELLSLIENNIDYIL